MSGVRDGDVSAEHQDVMAVDLVQQLTRAESQQLRLRRIKTKSAGTQPGVDVHNTRCKPAEWRPAGLSASVIFSCTTKSRRRFLLALAHLGSPRKRAFV